ncbi:hypothetical protein BJV77DRAFT_1131089 [Russula vinacea]|nr:hypothetical protein BJV77DRAFT_1131089 [Russula vinacea]
MASVTIAPAATRPALLPTPAVRDSASKTNNAGISGRHAASDDGSMTVRNGLIDTGCVDGPVLDVLIALKLSTQQWFTIQKMGQSLSRRSGHAMVSNGTWLFVLGGLLEAGTVADDSWSHQVVWLMPRQSFFPAPSGELKVTSTRKLRLGPSQRKSTNIPL